MHVPRQQALAPEQLCGPEAAPFVKWAGGKTQLLSELSALAPPRFERYFEPFVGGGAFFFYLVAHRPRFSAFLSDANADLVNAYRAVKRSVDQLVSALAMHERNYLKSPSSYYYRLRSDPGLAESTAAALSSPSPSSGRNLDVERAARFIALNKTCYNGLYRVNRRGRFNVPMGRYQNPSICDAGRLKKASAALNHSRASIVGHDYAEALVRAREGDFVYLDPPFIPLSQTANFVQYTRSGFGDRDQEKLAATFRELDRRGCRVLLSNSDTELVRDLYSQYAGTTTLASVLRAINCKGSCRKGHSELLVRNYEV